MNMQTTTKSPARVLGTFTQNINTTFLVSSSSELYSFCQLQIEHLTARYPIYWSRIIYHDPSIGNHQEITHEQPNKPLCRKILDYLNSQEYLEKFYTNFSLYEINITAFNSSLCYICPLGYRNQNPEYILVLAHEPLSLNLQQEVKQTAMLVSKYLDMYLESRQQKSEIQLLEQVIQRAGHQLRHTLATISIYAENLSQALTDSPWQEQAAIIRDSIQDLDSNLTELIYCSQKTKLRIALHDLKSILNETVQGLKPLIDQKQLQIYYPETSNILPIDRLQIKQVFDNLLSNAVHFSPLFGIISCSWQIFQNEVLICISDQGQGLSTEDINKIFTPFYSRRLGGTGLGLTIAKKIVLDHRGSLWAQNSLQGGAQFFISLPRSTN